ncbi:arylsulfatase [Humisphaera borealis]|uniref:Arylsulfatase n=1 Tax=Humisphaera borealis TaxID=2807512 RepID=A0A7M2X0I4_9BACT|nr:arylsulfatase [Humisphaera borealis]QOV90922.1 arylsulfatase [Humisphaera borealis]
MLPTKLIAFAATLLLACSSCTQTPSSSPSSEAAKPGGGGLDRTSLPIAEPPVAPITTLDARDAKAPPRFEVKPPAGAPNVVIVLIDDIGFGHSSAFGGPIKMPTLEKLAGKGLKYNRFHTTALCSPTRVALLTGHNHHANNAGAIMELATGFPGNTGVRPRTITTLAEILRQNGYSTAAFGKYHETPPWEVSVSGPYDRWPTGSGFDKFYGFIGGETNQWAPAIFDGVTRVEVPTTPGYHFTTDMTNNAINWVSAQKSLTPDKPFYMYFATGATHAPHHAPKEWIERYKGQFAGGWDKLREETFARQKALGVVPADTKLTLRPAEIPAWDGMSAQQKKLFERQMETFAGFAEHTDAEVGRLVEQLEKTGQLDNTLFFYIVGDNGSSAEGGPEGTYNEMMALNGIVGKAEQMMDHIDTWGDPTTFPHFAIGWAWAGNTPFQWTKQVASHFGGTRNGMVMHWPKGIKASGEVRSQFHHVVDIAPTALEAAKIPQPKMVNGIKQRPMDGVSMLYSTDAPKATDKRTTQYFEMFGNRGIYHEGWVACTRHSIPWLIVPLPPVKDDIWELYNVDEDFSEANNLAAKYPEKLKELQAVFLKEAERNHVLPIDDRRSERFNPAIAGRPDLLNGRKTLTVYPGMVGMMENAFINVKGVHHTITAEVDLKDDKTNGVIIAQAGYFGGWVVYMKDGKPHHEYNFFALERTNIAGESALPAGKHTISYEFIPDQNKPGTGGKSILSVDGRKVAEAKIPKTQPFSFSADEGADVGIDAETNVSKDYKPGLPSSFTGKIIKVTVEQK